MKKNGPYETFHESGQLKAKSNYNMGEKCGEWIEEGETATYDPCPPDLEDGNWRSSQPLLRIEIGTTFRYISSVQNGTVPRRFVAIATGSPTC